MTPDLDAIEAAARRAKPGPYKRRYQRPRMHSLASDCILSAAPGDDPDVALADVWVPLPEAGEDALRQQDGLAQLWTLLDPATVLALVALARATNTEPSAPADPPGSDDTWRGLTHGPSEYLRMWRCRSCRKPMPSPAPRCEFCTDLVADHTPDELASCDADLRAAAPSPEPPPAERLASALAEFIDPERGAAPAPKEENDG